MDLLSEDPGFLRVRRRLDVFSRTLWFDARGTGTSEGDPRDSLAGDIFDADLTSLLDAVGFQRPALAARSSAPPLRPRSLTMRLLWLIWASTVFATWTARCMSFRSGMGLFHPLGR
jgi:hypothetical protein